MSCFFPGSSADEEAGRQRTNFKTKKIVYIFILLMIN